MKTNYLSVNYDQPALPKKINSIDILLCTVLVTTLLIGLCGFFLMDTDLWDGVIVAHAVTIARPDIYHEWFNEAGLFFTPYIYDVAYLGRNLVGYELLAKFFSILFLALASIEVGNLATRYFKTPPNIALFTGLLFFLSPAWVLYYSNIYLMHSLSLFTTLIATRLILERKNLIIVLPALLLSFQQSSNAPLSISLILLSSAYIHTEARDRFINAIAILYVIVGFFALRTIFPTYGLYETYNEIRLDNVISIKPYARYILYFVTLYSPLLIFMIISLWHSRAKDLIKSYTIVMSGIMINGIAYIAVGKLPTLGEIGLIHGESLRFTFTSTVFAALLLPAIWQALEKRPKARVCFLLVVMIYACSINLFAHEGKMKEVLFQRGMVHELKKIVELPPCIVNIKSTGIGTLTNYEYGHIFYKAYGKVIQFPLGDSADPYIDAANAYRTLTKESYRHKYIIPQDEPNCAVDLYISTEIKDLSFIRTLQYYFSFKKHSIVKLRIQANN